jgi:hypothetical protein
MYSAAISRTQSTSELDQAEQLCALHSPCFTSHLVYAPSRYARARALLKQPFVGHP